MTFADVSDDDYRTYRREKSTKCAGRSHMIMMSVFPALGVSAYSNLEEPSRRRSPKVPVTITVLTDEKS